MWYRIHKTSFLPMSVGLFHYNDIIPKNTVKYTGFAKKVIKYNLQN